MAKSKKRSKEEMRALVQELSSRDPEDDVIVFARRSNARRLEQIDVLSQEITALEGIEKSNQYEQSAVERAARLVALEHSSLVEDIKLELEALRNYYETDEEKSG